MRWEAVSAIAGILAVIIGLIALFRSEDAAPPNFREPDVVTQQQPRRAVTTIPAAEVSRTDSTPQVSQPPNLASQPRWRTRIEADGRCQYSIRNDLQGADRETAVTEARADCARHYPPFQVFPDYERGNCRFTVRDDLQGWEREQARRAGQEACDRAMASIGLRRNP